MTVKELKDELSRYPDDMEVMVGIDHMISPLAKVTHGVDMDTNKIAVWLCDYGPFSECFGVFGAKED